MVLAQIESGVSDKQYLYEGALIMQDVFQLIEQLKQGNYNNYMGGDGRTSPTSYANNKAHLEVTVTGTRGANTKRTNQEDSKTLSTNLADSSIIHDNQSMYSKGTVGTIKAKRILQIKRLEKEFSKLSKRFEQVTDPLYNSDIKTRLRVAEIESKTKTDKMNKLEIE